jgi:hypothetical protein
MKNTTILLEFLRADWEAQRQAFETARALDASGVILNYPITVGDQGLLPFLAPSGDPPDSVPDSQSRWSLPDKQIL